MSIRVWLCSFVLVLAIALPCLAGQTVKLKDGTTLSGEVKKLGGSYSIVTPDLPPPPATPIVPSSAGSARSFSRSLPCR
jgi:hypothetical protein